MDPDANIIFGSNLNEELSGKIRVSLVATGIDDLANPSAAIVVEQPVIPEPKIEVKPAEEPVEEPSEEPVEIPIEEDTQIIVEP